MGLKIIEKAITALECRRWVVVSASVLMLLTFFWARKFKERNMVKKAEECDYERRIGCSKCVGIAEAFVSCSVVNRRKLVIGIRSARGNIHEK